MKKVIPERTIHICNRCEKEKEGLAFAGGISFRRSDAPLTLPTRGEDPQKELDDLDFCAECFSDFKVFIAKRDDAW